MDILIRGISRETIAGLDELAHRAGTSRMEYIRRLLEDQASGIDPDLVLGFFRLGGGELSAEAECVECGQPITAPWMGVTGSYRLFGPVCAGCANTG